MLLDSLEFLRKLVTPIKLDMYSRVSSFLIKGGIDSHVSELEVIVNSYTDDTQRLLSEVDALYLNILEELLADLGIVLNTDSLLVNVAIAKSTIDYLEADDIKVLLSILDGELDNEYSVAQFIAAQCPEYTPLQILTYITYIAPKYKSDVIECIEMAIDNAIENETRDISHIVVRTKEMFNVIPDTLARQMLHNGLRPGYKLQETISALCPKILEMDINIIGINVLVLVVLSDIATDDIAEATGKILSEMLVVPADIAVAMQSIRDYI